MSTMKSHGITLLLAVGMLALLGWVAVLRSDLARARQDRADQQHTAEALQAKLDQLRTAHEDMAARLKALTELPQGRAALPRETEPVEATPRVAPEAPAEAPSALLARGAISVEQQAGSRLAATLRFQQTADHLQQPFILVARIATDAYAEILGLAPTADQAYSDSSRRVAEGGKFAVFQGTPITGDPLEMVLSLSAPGTVSIHASNGLPPFSVDIQPGGATAEPTP